MARPTGHAIYYMFSKSVHLHKIPTLYLHSEKCC